MGPSRGQQSHHYSVTGVPDEYDHSKLSGEALQILVEKHNRLALHELDSIGTRRNYANEFESVPLSTVYCKRPLIASSALAPTQQNFGTKPVVARGRSSAQREQNSQETLYIEDELIRLLRDTDQLSQEGFRKDSASGSGYWISVVADAGYGKSSLVHHICSALKKQDQNFILFQSRDFPIHTMEPLSGQTALGLKISAAGLLHDSSLQDLTLLELLEALSRADRPPIVVLDTLDYLVGRLELWTVVNFLKELVGRGCKLFTTCRPKEHEDLCRLKAHPDKTFVLFPFKREQIDLAIARYVDVFYSERKPDDKMRQASQLVELSQNIRFERIFSNPLLSRMTFEVFAPGRIPDDLDTRRIYDEYWAAKVDHPATRLKLNSSFLQPLTRPAKVELSLSLAQRMLQTGQPFVEAKDLSQLTQDIDVTYGQEIGLLAQIDLVSENVLLPTATLRPVEFFHQTFFEYAAARYVSADISLKRLNKLQDYLRKHRDSVRLPVLTQSILLIIEKESGKTSINYQNENDDVVSAALLNQLWNDDVLAEIGFEVVAKCRDLHPALIEQLGNLVRYDAAARRTFLLSLRRCDHIKLAGLFDILLDSFSLSSPEDKEKWMEPLSFLASEYPEIIGELVTEMAPHFEEETLQKNHVGHYLREIYSRLAEHSPQKAITSIKKWLARPELPILCRQFILDALKPCVRKQGSKVLQILYSQAEFVSTVTTREALMQVASVCPPVAFRAALPKLMTDLNCGKFDRAIFAAMMLAEAPVAILKSQTTNIADLLIEGDIRCYDQLEPLFMRYCQAIPEEWWSAVTPPLHQNKKSAALRLLIGSSITTREWREWLLSQLDSSHQKGDKKDDQNIALCLSALRVLWKEDWEIVLSTATKHIEGANEIVLRGIVRACDVVPENEEQSTRVLLLLEQLILQANSQQTIRCIMDVAGKLAVYSPQHAQKLGANFYF